MFFLLWHFQKRKNNNKVQKSHAQLWALLHFYCELDGNKLTRIDDRFMNHNSKNSSIDFFGI
jgi:hypothetical protein